MQSSNYRFSRRTVLTVVAGGTALVGGVAAILPLSAESATDRGKVTCEGYADYLRKNGFEVRAVPTNDLTAMGEKYGISDSLQPCHISLIGGYVVGGHIPIEVVNRLLSEKPQIVGITLPGMPEGTPGMPGKKPGPLQIFEIGGGPPKVYATV
jgi:hypothetical protein